MMTYAVIFPNRKMDKLTLDENHIYRYDGTIVPGVSEILQSAGLVDFSTVPAERLEKSRKFGNAVHLTCEFSDRETLDDDSLDPALTPYLTGWEIFRQEYNLSFTAIETQLYSSLYRFAGTIDRIGHWRIDDSLLIIDIKSGADNPAIKIQLAAYELLVKEALKIKGKVKRLAVYLNGKGTYSIKEYKDKNDMNIFIGALSVYNWRKKYNLLDKIKK